MTAATSSGACAAACHAAGWVIRPARPSDIDALCELASLNGGGITSLPEDPDDLAERLARSEASFAAEPAAPRNELYVLVLEDGSTGRIGGTACLFARVGARRATHSFSLEVGRGVSPSLCAESRHRALRVCREFRGRSEVGGLFLHPDLRAAGLGGLLARSRYLFIAEHRARFAGSVVAELRGRLTPTGDASSIGRSTRPIIYGDGTAAKRSSICSRPTR